MIVVILLTPLVSKNPFGSLPNPSYINEILTSLNSQQQVTIAHCTPKTRDKISLLEQRLANFLYISLDIDHPSSWITQSLPQLVDSATLTQKQQ